MKFTNESALRIQHLEVAYHFKNVGDFCDFVGRQILQQRYATTDAMFICDAETMFSRNESRLAWPSDFTADVFLYNVIMFVYGNGNGCMVFLEMGINYFAHSQFFEL